MCRSRRNRGWGSGARVAQLVKLWRTGAVVLGALVGEQSSSLWWPGTGPDSSWISTPWRCPSTEVVAPGPDLEDRPDLIGALLVLNWDMSASPPPTVGKEVTDGQEAEAGNELGGGPDWQCGGHRSPQAHPLRGRGRPARRPARLSTFSSLSQGTPGPGNLGVELGPSAALGHRGGQWLGPSYRPLPAYPCPGRARCLPQSDRGARPQPPPGQVGHPGRRAYCA